MAGKIWSHPVQDAIQKADRTPEEAKMNMAHKPYIPSLIEENYMVKSMWDDFQRAFL